MAEREKVLQDERMCDFCGDWPYTKWWFSSQTIPAGTDVDFTIEMMEHPEWFACMECHVLLLVGDVEGLVTRALSVVKNDEGRSPEIRTYLTKVYTSLVQNARPN